MNIMFRTVSFNCMPIVSRATLSKKGVQIKKFRKTSVLVGATHNRRPKRVPFVFEWDVSRTPFSETDSRFGGGISKFIIELLSARRMGLRVLDWGCGAGVGANQLSKKFRPRFVKVLGWGVDFYPDWIKIARKGRVDFLQSNIFALEKYLAKHPVDVIYSDTALVHLNGVGLLERHLLALKSGLRQGGKIFITPIMFGKAERKTFVKNMRRCGYVVELIVRGPDADVILTKQ